MAGLHSSKTSVFYQAMPAVGADGKNIMKLIPVKMVNGQYHQTQTPQKFISLYNPSVPDHVAKKAAESQSTSQELIRKKVSAANVSPNQIHPVNRDLVNKSPPPQPTTNLMVKVRPTTAPSALSHQVPVTVKSPALPRGQFLKIPPNAQVQRLPASELPPCIKDQIFTSSSSSSAGSVPTVVYVSPVATVNQGVTEANDSTTPPLKLQSNTPRGLKPQLKLVPKVSERPNSPTRWVIEEVESCSADSLKTFNSPSVTSEDPQSAAETENLRRQTDNALVMYNGRVFFVTNKNSSSFKTSAATQTIVPSSRSHDPAVPQEGQNLKGLSFSAEVINLCDEDDALEDSHQQAPSSNSPAVSHQDEDNVIFVSYIPPKTESESMQTEQTGSGRSADVVALREGGHFTSVSNETNVCGSTVTESQRSISEQQLGDMEVEPETGSSAGHSSRTDFSQTLQDFKHLEPQCTSTPTPEPCQRSDHQLRQMFGIKSDVKICLQKVDEAPARCASADLLQTESKRTTEDDEKPKNCLKKQKLSPLDFYCTDEINNKTPTEHKPPAAFPPRTTPLNSSDIKLNTKPSSALKESCCSGQTTPRHSEAEAMIGYVEPIDEDFPDENGVHPASVETTPHLQTQTCVDANTFTRRMGRTRKRTLCPCCVPVALHPAVKSGLRLEELEAWMFITEQTGKKTGRSKSSRKDGRPSVKISYRNCKIHKAPGSNGLSPIAADPEKLKKHAEITRLREVQGEKET